MFMEQSIKTIPVACPTALADVATGEEDERFWQEISFLLFSMDKEMPNKRCSLIHLQEQSQSSSLFSALPPIRQRWSREMEARWLSIHQNLSQFF